MKGFNHNGTANFLTSCIPREDIERNEIVGFVRVGHSFRANGGLLGHFNTSVNNKGGD
ncbi:hypothetical protein GTHT12_02831 [Geobacillus thermodenitrificans]|nr:hypothetical protein GTHT12_02831 [Geobacillus thermodenitrificans]